MPVSSLRLWCGTYLLGAGKSDTCLENDSIFFWWGGTMPMACGSSQVRDRTPTIAVMQATIVTMPDPSPRGHQGTRKKIVFHRRMLGEPWKKFNSHQVFSAKVQMHNIISCWKTHMPWHSFWRYSQPWPRQAPVKIPGEYKMVPPLGTSLTIFTSETHNTPVI